MVKVNFNYIFIITIFKNEKNYLLIFMFICFLRHTHTHTQRIPSRVCTLSTRVYKAKGRSCDQPCPLHPAPIPEVTLLHFWLCAFRTFLCIDKGVYIGAYVCILLKSVLGFAFCTLFHSVWLSGLSLYNNFLSLCPTDGCLGSIFSVVVLPLHNLNSKPPLNSQRSHF